MCLLHFLVGQNLLQGPSQEHVLRLLALIHGRGGGGEEGGGGGGGGSPGGWRGGGGGGRGERKARRWRWGRGGVEGSGATRKRQATRSGRGDGKGVESLAALEGPPFEGRARRASAPVGPGVASRPPASLVPPARRRRRNPARAAVFPGPRA